MTKVRVTQTRSPIGENQRNRGTLRALGLRKIGQTVEHDETPVLTGMLRKVRHLVRIENG
jgi:large subunit ribosomal protein L30